LRIAFGHSPSETSICWEQRGWIEYGILETVTRDCLEEIAGELRLIVAVGGSAPAQACDRFAAQRQGNAGDKAGMQAKTSRVRIACWP
jgi:hypothetical protein